MKNFCGGPGGSFFKKRPLVYFLKILDYNINMINLFRKKRGFNYKRLDMQGWKHFLYNAQQGWLIWSRKH